MGCRFSQLNPGLHVYDARLEANNAISGVDGSGNLLFRPYLASPQAPPTTDYGDPVYFACQNGKKLALDGQVLNQVAYLYVCPDLGLSEFTNVDIGARLSCVN